MLTTEDLYDYEYERQRALEDDPAENIMDSVRVVVPDDEFDNFVWTTKPLLDNDQVKIVKSVFQDRVPHWHTAWDVLFLIDCTRATRAAIEAVVESYGG